jgi:hypothetical protein
MVVRIVVSSTGEIEPFRVTEFAEARSRIVASVIAGFERLEAEKRE